MSPVLSIMARGNVVEKPSNPDELILEAWAQGFLVGSLVIMSFITLANMRRGVLLHKLILLELILGLWQGFWLFFKSPVHAWWLSVAAILLNASWSLHNVIAWMKIKPFLSKPVSYIFIGTVILAQPYWVLEIYANFAYFHGLNDLFLRTRPWEALCRDPWWILTTLYLFWVIKTQYEMTVKEIVRISPRFAVMLLAMILSIVFIILDIFSVTKVIQLSGRTGINPFWKLAFVFKCLTDSVVLDDFKMALDRLRAFKISRLGSFSGDMSDSRSRNDGNLVATWEEMEREANALQEVRSPDGDYIHPSNFPYKPKRARRAHKDSVVSPDHIHWHNTGAGLEPEDIVPSALDDRPMRSMENAQPVHKKLQHRSIDDVDSCETSDMIAEIDYAEAMREVQRDSVSTNRRTSGSPRRITRS
ncbi:Nn.00g078180.m01.CDS01 [Neocucurbitaria sp. VM-36]